MFLVVFWIALFLHGSKTGFYNYLYSFLFGLIPLIGGMVAMTRVRRWGGFKSAVGKAVFFIGAGLSLWGTGDSIWAYYNFFLHIGVPYPSLADVAFLPSIFFYGLGTVYLAKATGLKIVLENRYAKIFAAVATTIVFLVSYYVLVIVARGGVLISSDSTLTKTILDIAYPLGDFVSLMLAVVISGFAFRYLKSKYRYDIIAVLMGLAVMFVGDAVFSYTTTINTFYNGSVEDLIFTIGMFLLTFGVLGFYTPQENRGSSPDMSIYGNSVVFTSAADDFALVVENKELAEALRKGFLTSFFHWIRGIKNLGQNQTFAS